MRHRIPLPRAWNRRTKAAILQILALSHYAFTALLARAMNERSCSPAGTADLSRCTWTSTPSSSAGPIHGGQVMTAV